MYDTDSIDRTDRCYNHLLKKKVEIKVLEWGQARTETL